MSISRFIYLQNFNVTFDYLHALIILSDYSTTITLILTSWWLFLCSSAHPKAKVFLTHGGSHSVYEGICNAVPMLIFPLFADQGDNAIRLESRGVAEHLSIFEVTPDSIEAKLNKMVNDKR